MLKKSKYLIRLHPVCGKIEAKTLLAWTKYTFVFTFHNTEKNLTEESQKHMYFKHDRNVISVQS